MYYEALGWPHLALSSPHHREALRIAADIKTITGAPPRFGRGE